MNPKNLFLKFKKHWFLYTVALLLLYQAFVYFRHFYLEDYGYVDYYLPDYQVYLRATKANDSLFWGISQDKTKLDYVGRCPDSIDFFVTGRNLAISSSKLYFSTEKIDTLRMYHMLRTNSVEFPMADITDSIYRMHHNLYYFSGEQSPINPKIRCLDPYLDDYRVILCPVPDSLRLVELRRRFL